MHRLDRKDLETELSMALRRALTANRFALRSKLASVKEEAMDAVIAEVFNVVDNESRCVMEAEIVGSRMSARRGKFGQDEPWPGETVLVQRMALGPVAYSDPL